MCFQEDGIQEFLKVVQFYGEYQMYCDQCEDKRDTTLVSEMKPVLFKCVILQQLNQNRYFDSILKCIENALISY